MDRQKEQIKMWNGIYEAIARTCKMTGPPGYPWLILSE